MNLQKQIDELLAQRAAQWVDILRRGSEPDHAAFLAWVAESPRNLDEFLSIAALDEELEERGLYATIDGDALLKQVQLPTVRLSQKSRAGQELRATVGNPSARGRLLAATVLITAFTGWFFLHASTDDVVTSIGEQRSLQLPDGSSMYLNARSHAEIRYTPSTREILLEDGEALFNVAPQAGRPFQVRTRDAVIEALGTQFNVASRTSGTRVAVLEGKVQVSHSNDAANEMTALEKGQAADITHKQSNGQRMQVTSKADVSSMAAWRQRRLVFVKAPLEEVVDEFNRFNRRPIRLENIHGGDRHYSGTFDADDPQALVAFLEKEPDLDVRVGEEEILIRSRVSPAHR